MTLTKPPFISAQDDCKWLHVCLIARATSQQSRNERIHRIKVTSTKSCHAYYLFVWCGPISNFLSKGQIDRTMITIIIMQENMSHLSKHCHFDHI